MNAVVDPGGVISSNNSDLDKKESVATLKKQKSISNVEGKEKHFDIPLSIFRYKGYDSDFFTSWYNILREIFEEIKEMCPEKWVLNLALSVLMLPYIASISLGLVVYSRSKADGKIQTSLEGNKTKKSEVSESTAKRLAYSVLAAVAILVNIVVLVTLIIPATLALATFYLLNKKLSHSLVATVKIGSGLYKNEHQNIKVSFHEADAGESDIRWDMEIKFPPQFEQLLRDLCEDKNDKLFVTQDAEHNTILKLSANVHFKNGLVPLRNEIRSMLATSIQGFTEAMGELLKLDKKDITYNKLKELLNEFRLKAVNSVDPKLTSHLIQDAYRVAFMQAIKFAQQRRKEGFSLEERVKEVLVEQELKSQGKELPTEKEIIIEDLKNAGIKVRKNLKDEEFSVRKATWEKLVRESKIAKRTVIDVCKDAYLTETKKALDNAKQEIERLREVSREMYEKLEEAHNRGNNNLRDGTLKRKLEDLFKFEGSDQEVEGRLIKSVIKRAKGELNRLGILEKQGLERFKERTHAIWNLLFNKDKEQNLRARLKDLEKNKKILDEVNDFIKEIYLEIKQHKVQKLLQEQKEGVLDLCETLKEYEPGLAEMIEAFRKQDQGHLEVEQTLKDQNERLKAKLNDREERHPCTKSIKVLLKRNQEILKALEDLESEKEELLINEEAKNDYREELTSREKIKFAIIEDKLLKIIKASSEDELLKIVEEAFSEGELLEIKETSKDKPLKIIRQVAIKKLLEKAELEYCLAEQCIKYPVIKTKDNIKHFCQALLSPLIGNLVENIINNVPKNDKSPWRQPRKSFWTAYGYIKTGVVTAIYGNQSTEGKALKVAHDTYKEVETFLQYFESSYEEVGSLIGDVFSDDGETFKKDIWPQIKNHLLGMWDGFSKDVEFTLISKDKNISQETEGTVETELDELTAQKHDGLLVNSAQAAGA